MAGRLRQRLQAMDGVDALALLRRKMEKCFCNGTYDLHAFLDDRPQNDTTLHHFLMPDSAGYDNYRHLCNSVEMGIFALSLEQRGAVCEKNGWMPDAGAAAVHIGACHVPVPVGDERPLYREPICPCWPLCAAQGMQQAAGSGEPLLRGGG